MKHLLPVLLLLAGCASTPQRDLSPAVANGVAHVEGVVARGKLPGAAIAVTVGEDIVWHDTFGKADLAADRPVTIHTRFRIGSVTKMVTVAAMMRLVEEGRMPLAEPVAKSSPALRCG